MKSDVFHELYGVNHKTMAHFMLVRLLCCYVCVLSNLISYVFPEKWKPTQQIEVIYFLNLIQINYVLNTLGNGKEEINKTKLLSS